MQNVYLNYPVLGFVVLICLCCAWFAYGESVKCKAKTLACWSLCQVESKLEKSYRAAPNFSMRTSSIIEEMIDAFNYSKTPRCINGT